MEEQTGGQKGILTDRWMDVNIHNISDFYKKEKCG